MLKKISKILTIVITMSLLLANISFGYISKQNDDLAGWASKSMVDLFTYDHKNAQTHFRQHMHLFTESGWEQFLTLLKKSEGLDLVIENKMLSYASLITPSEVIYKKTVEDGILSKVNVSLSSHYSKLTSDKKTNEIAEDFILELIIAEYTNNPPQILAINKIEVPYPNIDNL